MIKSLLHNIQSLITLSPAEIDIVTSLFTEKRYKKGDFFLAEGQVCNKVGFVGKGLLRYYINHNGEEKTYAFRRKIVMSVTMKVFFPGSPLQK